MFNVTGLRPHGRREEAFMFAVFVTAFLFFSIVAATYNQYSSTVTLAPNSFKTISLEGHGWETVSISIHSSEPVTVCITDESGVRMLYSGQNALCYFYRPDVRNLDELWRFPGTGKYYLVIMAGETGARVKIKLVTGIATV